jgi:hypothetical protein
MNLLIAILGTSVLYVLSVFLAKPCACHGERCGTCPFKEARDAP